MTTQTAAEMWNKQHERKMTFSCIAFLLLLHSPWLLFLRVAIYRDTRVKWFFIKAPWDLHQQTRFPLSARCVWREAWCRTVIAALAGLMMLGELWKNDVKGVVWKVWPHLLPSAIFPDLLSSTAAHGVLCTENSGVKKTTSNRKHMVTLHSH